MNFFLFSMSEMFSVIKVSFPAKTAGHTSYHGYVKKMNLPFTNLKDLASYVISGIYFVKTRAT